MSKNYPSFEEIYNNINDVINDKNMIINTQSDEYNTYNDESKLRTFNIVKTHFELNEYTGYETLLKQFLVNKDTEKRETLRSTLLDLKKEKIDIMVQYINNNNIFDRSFKTADFFNKLGFSIIKQNESINEIFNILNIEGYYDIDKSSQNYIKREQKIINLAHIESYNNIKEYILLLNYYVELVKNLIKNKININIQLKEKIDKTLSSWTSENRSFLKKYDKTISMNEIISIVRDFSCRR